MHMDDVEMNQNLVSIVMPAYNSSRFIASSIDSVLAQTYENWELLIVETIYQLTVPERLLERTQARIAALG